MKKNKIKLFVTLSFALLMAFGNVNSVSAAKSTTKSTPYGTLKGFISPYNSGSSKLCEGGTTIGQNVKSIKKSHNSSIKKITKNIKKKHFLQ